MVTVTMTVEFSGVRDPYALGFKVTDADEVSAESLKRMFNALGNAGFDCVGIEYQERPGYEIYRGMKHPEA